MRRYQELWKRIASKETVTIICPVRGEWAIRAAIYNEKYWNNKSRDAVGLPGFGRINITRTPMEDKPEYIRLIISIPYSGDNI